MAVCEDAVCCQEIFVGDTDLPIQFHVHTCDTTVEPRVESELDISSATLEIKFKKPDDSYTDILTGELVTDGTDGLAEYITLSDTLDLEGTWKGQMDVIITGSSKATSIISFKVLEKL